MNIEKYPVWPSFTWMRCTAASAWLLFAPMSVMAFEIKGKLSVGALDEEVLPAYGTGAVPLKEATVILGLVERNPNWEPLGLFAGIATTRTDENGNYSFYLGADPPPDTPLTPVDYALIVVLDSIAVRTFDAEAAATDAYDKPACLASATFKVPQSGVHQADFDLLADGGGIGLDVSSSLTIKGAEFEAVPDSTTGILFGKRPDCDEAILTGPGPVYDVRGFANGDPERFAHLGILHARAYDAFEFLRDGLSDPILAPLRIRAWEDFDTIGYLCSLKEILVNPDLSDFFGPFKEAHLDVMRHEYGHHFTCASAIAGVDQQIPRPQGDKNHKGLQNSTSADALAEGFATYFAAVVTDYKGEATPHLQHYLGGKVDLGGDLIFLDNPLAPGEQRSYDNLGEEFSVASLLWHVSQQIGFDSLISNLVATGVNLLEFEDVYTTLILDPSVDSFYPDECYFNDALDSVASGVDCLFIERGFYHDANGDGLYTNVDEFVSANTRWPLTGPYARAADTFRSGVPFIEGSMLRLSAIDSQSQPMSLDRFDIQIEYDPPFDTGNFAYSKDISGDGPYEFPITIPARPSRAVITAIKNGLPFADPVSIESEFYHQRIDSLGGNPVEPILLEHVFSETTNPPSGPIFENGFEEVSGLD